MHHSSRWLLTITGFHSHALTVKVDEFGRMPNCVPGLISLVNTLAATTFQTLNSPVALEQNPDTIEDLFR